VQRAEAQAALVDSEHANLRVASGKLEKPPRRFPATAGEERDDRDLFSIFEISLSSDAIASDSRRERYTALPYPKLIPFQAPVSYIRNRFGDSEIREIT